MRDLLNEAHFTLPLRRNMWAFPALLVTKFDNILLCPQIGTTPHELQPVWINHLHTFSEIAIDKHLTNMKSSKIKNKGFPGIYVGPADDHKEEVYTFWNPRTRCSVHSRSGVFFTTIMQNFIN
jgi:hypothetical protein